MLQPLSLLVLPLLSLPAAAQGTVPDAWSDSVRLRTPDGYHAVPVHASLLPDGRVFCIGYDRNAEDPDLATDQRARSFVITPVPLGGPIPDDHVVDVLAPPVDFSAAVIGNVYVADDLFCAGHALDADGAVMTVGGTRYLLDLLTGESVTYGLPYATRFDGSSWDRVAADMAVTTAVGGPARWYPAVTRLPDERLLVTGGYDVVDPTPSANLSAEIYDPQTGSWEILSDYGTAPFEIFNEDYTQPFVLPYRVGNADLLMFGFLGVPVGLSLTGGDRWTVSTQARTGTLPGEAPNSGASSLMLPIRRREGSWGYSNGSALVAGGDHETTHQSSFDVYDPVADSWLLRGDLSVPRHHPTSVLLPDGRVLIVAGHAETDHPDLGRATYIDPAAGFSAALGDTAAAEVRGYHHVALLLPDGRVLVGGGRDLETASPAEKSTFRYLYPSYFLEPRPELAFAPEEIGHGQIFPIQVLGDAPRDVVLVSLGSMTHSFDFNQRHVQLSFSKQRPFLPGSGILMVKGPANERIAPPGHYMLFVLDENRIPSEAKIVRVR